MGEQNTFSFAICTYNGEKTLRKAVDSILEQNSFAQLVTQVLLIDNASTDKTAEICREYEKKNEKVLYIYEEKPGLANARRRAVNATGDWVIYVDDDNVLDCNWLAELQKTVIENPTAGIINGAVIAWPSEQLSEEEEIRLQLLHRNLACTHVREMDPTVPENKQPMGAGMCVRTQALRRLDADGWLKLMGRTGKQLLSGEDTELAAAVFAQGYSFVSNYKMYMYHLIPAARLSEAYTERLLTGLAEGWYAYISGKRGYVLQRLLRAVKYVLIYGKNSLFRAHRGKPIQIEKQRHDRIRAKAFLRCVWRDKLFHK